MKSLWAAAVLVLGLTLLMGCKEKKPEPEELLAEYMDLLGEEKYEEMYTYLTEEAKESIDQEAYVERYQNIYGGIEAMNIRVEIEEREEGHKDKKAVTQRVKYALTMDTLAGELSFNNIAIFTKDEEGLYKMSWDSQDILPGLYAGDKVRIKTIQAKRGNIYDQNQTTLAREGTASSVGLVPGKLGENREESLASLSELLEISVERIEKELNAGWVRDDTFVPLRTVSKDDYELKEQLLEIPGVMITDTTVRYYPFKEKAAQLTGYVQNITAEELEERKGQGYNQNSQIGKAGAERIYEEILRPRDGYSIQIIDADGYERSTVLEKPAEDGRDVVLTIDIILQQHLYQALEGDEGCAAAIDPRSGAVLAMASAPAYDPNDFVMGYTASAWDAVNNDETQPLYNRYLASWVPGSVFKPVTAALGLTNGSLNPGEEMENEGLSWQKDESWGSYEVTTLTDYPVKNLENALIYSDNIYFAKVAVNMGEEAFSQGLDSLGFGEEMEFDFDLKASSYGSEGKLGSETELADSAYGQGKVLVNPLHLAAVYSAFVNEGNMVKLYLRAGGEEGFWKEQVFTPEAAGEVLNGLYQVVEHPEGTAREAYRSGYRLAGKTGTAEIKDSKEDTSGTELGWFVGISGADTDKPLLMVMMIEDVKGRGGSHYVIPKAMTGFDVYNMGEEEEAEHEG